MKRLHTACATGMLLLLAGCGQGTSGGPGAANPPEKNSVLGQADDTFSISMPPVALVQGERKAFTLEISRGKNFKGNVSVKFDGLPAGVTADVSPLVLQAENKEVKLTLVATDTAAVGDYAFTITGHPTSGANAVSKVKLSISAPENTASDAAASEAAKAAREQEIAALQKQYEEFTLKYKELTERAVKAEGDAKIALDARVAAAKIKIENAATKLDELKTAGGERWDKIKKALSDAFEDLKKAFE